MEEKRSAQRDGKEDRIEDRPENTREEGRAEDKEAEPADLQKERRHLAETIELAGMWLIRAEDANERSRQDIADLKKELREETSHGFSNLYASDDFEAMAELAQYAAPINDKLVRYDEVEREITRLHKVMLAPYFARIDFRFEGEEDYERIYIGRSALKEAKGYEMAVYDWRSPIAGMFYRYVTGPASYEAPQGTIRGDINKKRQYEIRDGQLAYYFDADVQIVDEFLKQMLSGNASPKMKTVVETIQKEQDVVIRDLTSDLVMVQGVAGSGKTSIALHRAAYLMYQGLSERLGANNILIISPNTLFEQYISEVLPELGEEDVASLVFGDIMKEALPGIQIQTRNEFYDRMITGKGAGAFIKRSMEYKSSGDFIALLDRLIADIPKRFIPYTDVRYEGVLILTAREVEDKVCAGLDVTPIGRKVRLIQDYIVEQIAYLRRRRVSQEEADTIRKETLSFLHLDLVRIYRRLFLDEAYFRFLSKGMTLPADIGAIIAHTKKNLSGERLFYDDAVALTYLKMRVDGTDAYRNIKQVVIDEAQDYYPIQYETYRCMFPGAKFTILGDINQTLDKEENIGFYRMIAESLGRKKASLVTLRKSFRCTKEILAFSEQFLEGFPATESFNRSGEAPEVISVPDMDTLLSRILSETAVCREKGYASVGLICKNRAHAQRIYEGLRDRLDLTLVGDGRTREIGGVFAIPVYMSKGLEFDAVLIVDGDERTYRSADDKKLLYVASTRALHRLTYLCVGRPARWVGTGTAVTSGE